jgi:aspartate/methionine/tyrosine aminotransferase
MPLHLSPKLTGVHPPPIGEVAAWRALSPPGLPIIDLCQAVPNYPPSADLVAHLQGVLADPLTSRYSPDEGLADVREAICSRYQRRYAGQLTPEQFCLTIGASQAFWLAILATCQAGDEVIVQLPCYFDHPMALAVLGITVVYTPYDGNSPGLPDPAAIAALITPRTRAILLVTPSNPTGTVTPPAVIDALYDLAVEHQLALIIDETYSDFLSAEEPPHRLFSRPGWDEHFIQIMSFGKTYALTGYRAGLLAGSRQLIREVLKIQDTMVVCQPRITQQAIKYGVMHLDSWVAANCAMMQHRHNAFRQAFMVDGNPFTLVASGSFFAWVRHPFPELDSRAVARLLAQQAGILTLPGAVFGPGLERYLRFALGNLTEEQIPETIARLQGLQPPELR